MTKSASLKSEPIAHLPCSIEPRPNHIGEELWVAAHLRLKMGATVSVWYRRLEGHAGRRGDEPLAHCFYLVKMVDAAGIEPATPTMST